LLQGVATVLITEPVVRDPRRLVTALAEAKVTRIVLVPSLLRVLLDEHADLGERLPRLSHWTSSGEALAGDLAERFFERLPGRVLVNLYGSSEVAADATWFEVTPNVRSGPTPIGWPIDNVQAYILDAQRRPVPVGVPGELHIGGLGLARGYHHRPELTAEKFIPDPFRSAPEARLYKTGDLARYLPSGTIEYLGRLDHQVKIRGFRIELGEIESVLAGFPGVRQAVVFVRQDVPGNEQLVAYIKVKEEEPPTDSELRVLLRAELPEYMIPSALVILDYFPLTPNGKVDRKALPRPDLQSLNPAEFAPPRTETETALADIWRRALGLDRVGLHDNFFELGGHSLLAVRVIAETNKMLGVYVNVPQFFQNPTIELLARALDEGHHLRPRPRALRLQPGHAGPPLYFIGAGPVEIRIAKLIGKGRAIFGTDVPMPMAWRRAMANADRAAWPTMEQLGALHGDVVLAHAGTSPCVVAGYSFQGKVVIEAARALQRAGGNPALVLLIDSRAWTGTVHGIGQTVWRNLRSTWRGFATGKAEDTRYIESLSAPLRNSWYLLRWLLAQAPPGMKRPFARARSPNAYIDDANGFVDEEGTPVGLANMHLFFRILMMSFQPRPLDAAAVLFRTMHPSDQMLPRGALDQGWGGLFSRGLKIVQVRGDHWSLVRDERNTAALARQINEVLDQYASIGSEGRSLDQYCSTLVN
jgi:thioesterase domain-containing protein